MIIIPLSNVEYGSTKYEKFLHFKRLGVFLLVNVHTYVPSGVIAWPCVHKFPA